VETYLYDAAGNLTNKTDRNSHSILYVYDALNRLTHKGYPDSTGVDYVYDLAGKIKQVTDPTGTYAMAYDNMGRLIGTTTQYSFLPGAPTFSNSYAYDAASNRTSLTLPDGSSDGYQYDTLNRLKSLTDSLTGQFNFSYDTLSRRTGLTRPNGVNTNYGYDSLSRLLSVLHQSGANTLDGASYTYDSAGNRTAKTNKLNNITEEYTYDPLYQLTQVAQGATTTESYSYDAVGNRLSSLGVSSYSYNSSNELTSTSAAAFTYDNNGNTLTKADSTGTRNYTWDFENRLASVVLPGTGGTATFKYDPFGRRIQKAFTQNSTTTLTNYLYDGSTVIEEVDANGSELGRYAQGAGIDEPLAELRSGTTGYYEQDGLGSVTSLSNPTGALANTYTYDTFGNLTASTGAFANPFQYTGRDYDSETGLRYYRARYYDPTIGRFISEDLLGVDEHTYNLYNYVSGDPVDFNDPSGLVKIHGNWCGPNWTGGRTEAYIPSHDQNGYYKVPIDYVDKVCVHHDKCYSKCRAKHPCSPWGRRGCEKKCDFGLAGRLLINPVDAFNPWAYIVGLGVGANPFPSAGPNGGAEPDHPVPCCKQPTPKSTPNPNPNPNATTE
jgi:RHS repeat-associated protein